MCMKNKNALRKCGSDSKGDTNGERKGEDEEGEEEGDEEKSGGGGIFCVGGKETRLWMDGELREHGSLQGNEEMRGLVDRGT